MDAIEVGHTVFIGESMAYDATVNPVFELYDIDRTEDSVKKISLLRIFEDGRVEGELAEGHCHLNLITPLLRAIRAAMQQVTVSASALDKAIQNARNI